MPHLLRGEVYGGHDPATLAECEHRAAPPSLFISNRSPDFSLARSGGSEQLELSRTNENVPQLKRKEKEEENSP